MPCAVVVISCANDAYWLYEAVIEYCGGYGGGASDPIELRRSIDVVAKLLYPSISLPVPVDTKTVPFESVELIFICVIFSNGFSFVGDDDDDDDDVIVVGVVCIVAGFASIWMRFDL